MKRLMYLLIAVSALFMMFGCAPQVVTMQSLFPQMYQNTPATILILPPVNNSTAADAKEYFACSLAEAVGKKGYYTMPVEAVFGILRDEGLYDTENLNPTIISNLKKNFGADAVLFTTIEKWDKSWALLSGSLKIDAKFALLSTANADTLWNYTVHTKVKLKSNSDNILAAAVESAIKTALEDYFPNCLQANKMTMDQTLPYGKHHPNYGKDAENSVSPLKYAEIEISK